MAKNDYIHIKHLVGNDVMLTTAMASMAGRQIEGDFVTDGKISWYRAETKSRSGKVIESVQVPAEQILSITVHKKDV